MDGGPDPQNTIRGSIRSSLAIRFGSPPPPPQDPQWRESVDIRIPGVRVGRSVGRPATRVFTPTMGIGAAEMLLSTLWLFLLPVATSSPDARRLYDDLLSNYNR